MALAVYTYGGGDALFEIFNAIAATMGSANYGMLIQIAGLFGLLWIMVTGAFGQRLNWQWFFGYMFILGVAFWPKVEVHIVDRIVPSSNYVVANIPFGVAQFAHMSSTIGDGITRMMEANFSLPDDLKYSQNGMVFSSRLASEMSKARIYDPTLEQNLIQFGKQCMIYSLAMHWISPDTIVSGDLTSGSATSIFNPGNYSQLLGMFYETSTGNSFMTCAVAAPVLEQAVIADSSNSLTSMARKIWPGLPAADRESRFNAMVPVAYEYLYGEVANAQVMRVQYAMQNFLRDLPAHLGAATDSQTMLSAYSVAVAEEQQRNAYRTMIGIAAKQLPLLRIVIESLVYGVFPLVFLAMLLPIGVKAIMTYLQVMVWTQLWAPMYAILNLIMTVYARGLSSGVSHNHMMAGALGPINEDLVLMAGYMGMSVPVIAWGFVSGGGHALSSLAGHVMAPASSAASQSAGEAARGNINMGNTGIGSTNLYQQHLGPTTDVTGGFRDLSSSKIMGHGADGQMGQRTQQTMSSFATGVDFSNQISGQLSKASGTVRTASINESVEAGKSLVAAMNHSTGQDTQHGHSKDAANKTSVSTTFTGTDGTSTVERLTNAYQNGTGLTKAQATTLALTAFGQVSKQIGGQPGSGDKPAAKDGEQPNDLPMPSDLGGDKAPRSAQPGTRIPGGDIAPGTAPVEKAPGTPTAPVGKAGSKPSSFGSLTKAAHAVVDVAKKGVVSTVLNVAADVLGVTALAGVKGEVKGSTAATLDKVARITEDFTNSDDYTKAVTVARGGSNERSFIKGERSSDTGTDSVQANLQDARNHAEKSTALLNMADTLEEKRQQVEQNSATINQNLANELEGWASGKGVRLEHLNAAGQAAYAHQFADERAQRMVNETTGGPIPTGQAADAATRTDYEGKKTLIPDEQSVNQNNERNRATVERRQSAKGDNPNGHPADTVSGQYNKGLENSEYMIKLNKTKIEDLGGKLSQSVESTPTDTTTAAIKQAGKATVDTIRDLSIGAAGFIKNVLPESVAGDVEVKPRTLGGYNPEGGVNLPNNDPTPLPESVGPPQEPWNIPRI